MCALAQHRHTNQASPFNADVDAVLLACCHQVHFEALNLCCQLLDHSGFADALVELQQENGASTLHQNADFWPPITGKLSKLALLHAHLQNAQPRLHERRSVVPAQ